MALTYPLLKTSVNSALDIICGRCLYFAMTLGELIGLSRELKKMSLRDLEAKSGVSNALISQIESGRVLNPGFRTLCKLADALGLSLKRLAETE